MEDKGTRVRLRFPACKNETQATAIAAADATLSHHWSLKVLLVDDDDLIQSSVQAILEALGHAMMNTAMNGEEALAGHAGVTLLSKPFGLREFQRHLEHIGLG